MSESPRNSLNVTPPIDDSLESLYDYERRFLRAKNRLNDEATNIRLHILSKEREHYFGLENLKKEAKLILEEIRLEGRKNKYKQKLEYNVELLKDGFLFEEIDFIYGEKPKNLPPINRIEDIDNLSKKDCITYLRGYGKYSNDVETIDLKREVAYWVGFRRPVDRNYPWSSF